MARKSTLDRAYKAIAKLRSKPGGGNLSIDAVRKDAGLAKGTIYSKDKDWEEVRSVIENNENHPQVDDAFELLVDDDELEEKLGAIRIKISQAEEEIKDLRGVANSVYAKILDQLHKYVLLAKETPAKKNTSAKYLKELSQLKNENKRLLSQIKELETEKGLPADVRVLGKKEIITVFDASALCRNVDIIDLSLDAINSLDEYFERENSNFWPSVVYVMCGNFASGKSSWIKNHKPIYAGINLYLDGPNHSREIRKAAIKRIQKLSPSCKIICVRMMSSYEDCVDFNISAVRKRNNMIVSSELIDLVEKEFVEVSKDEGFDAIEFAKKL